MNKAINYISGFVIAIYCVIVMAIIYDLSFATNVSAQSLPFKFEICTGFAIIVFLLGVLRIKRRWQGAIDMKRFKNFHFVRAVAPKAIKLSLVFTVIEIVFIVLFSVFLYRMSILSPEYVLPMIGVMGFLFIENIIFTIKIIKKGESFRIGIDKNAVAYFDREMHILYFSGLKKIEMHQDMINFQYIKKLNIFIPLRIIEKEDIIPFRDALINTIETHLETKKGKTIYIDDAFRTLE